MISPKDNDDESSVLEINEFDRLQEIKIKNSQIFFRNCFIILKFQNVQILKFQNSSARDNDDESSVLEMVSKLNEVKGVKGLGRFFKQVCFVINGLILPLYLYYLPLYLFTSLSYSLEDYAVLKEIRFNEIYFINKVVLCF